MSKPISPTAIGGFTLGALALLVIGLLIFGGGQAFNADKVRFVVFLESSLNGLDIGAPVKMQGVKIGEVKEIALQFDEKRNKLFKPVVIEIDRGLLSGSGEKPLPTGFSQENLTAIRDRLVASGFRARLEMQSLLTGLLFVDLDVHPDKPPMFAELDYRGLLEIPGVPATTDEIRNTAEEVVQKLRSMPLDQIVQDLADSLGEIKTLLASEDTRKTQVSLTNTLQEVEKTIGTLNRHLDPLLRNTSATVAGTEALVKETQMLIKQLNGELPKVLSSSDKTLQSAASALNQAENTMRQVDTSLGPESALTETLQAFKQAARAIRDLSDYLERHPEALLSGKKDQ